jgi:hypothetical protein
VSIFTAIAMKSLKSSPHALINLIFAIPLLVLAQSYPAHATGREDHSVISSLAGQEIALSFNYGSLDIKSLIAPEPTLARRNYLRPRIRPWRPLRRWRIVRWYRAPVITGLTLLGSAVVFDLISDSAKQGKDTVEIPDTEFGLLYSSVSAKGINDISFDYRVAGATQSASADCEAFTWASPPTAPRQPPATPGAQQLLHTACIVAYGE